MVHGIVLVAEICCLIGLNKKNPGLILFWQIIFMLYFGLICVAILAWAGFFAIFALGMINNRVFKLGESLQVLCVMLNALILISSYIWYFYINRVIWSDAYKDLIRKVNPVAIWSDAYNKDIIRKVNPVAQVVIPPTPPAPATYTLPPTTAMPSHHSLYPSIHEYVE